MTLRPLARWSPLLPVALGAVLSTTVPLRPPVPAAAEVAPSTPAVPTPDGPTAPGSPSPAPVPTAPPGPVPAPPAGTPVAPAPRSTPSLPPSRPQPDPAPPAAAETVLRTGHVDVAVRRDGPGLRTELVHRGGGGPPERLDPARTTIAVPDGARTTIPPGGSFEFLGRAGDPVWILPQVQDPQLVWLGWNTEQIPPGSIPGGIRWALLGVRGPGTFALFTTDQFGRPAVLVDSDGTERVTDVPLGAHAHGNWAFVAGGDYALDMEVSGNGVRPERFTLRFRVGSDTPGPPTTTTTVPAGRETAGGTGATPAAAGPSSGPPGPATLARTGVGSAVVPVAAGLGCLVLGVAARRAPAAVGAARRRRRPEVREPGKA